VKVATTAAVFEAYVEKAPASTTLRAGQIEVMDNLSAHNGDRVRDLVEERSCQPLLWYLPPYSPDLNSVEGALGKTKGIVRKAGTSRSREALVEGTGAALAAITPRGAGGVFEHCGYRLPVQAL
jgi:transposase